MNRFLVFSLGVLATAAPVFGQPTVATAPVGLLSTIVPAQSDAVLAVPLFRTPVFQGRVASISGSQITLNATPVLAVGGTYALMLGSGGKAGLVAKITAQAEAVVTVQVDADEDLTGVVTGADGERVTIMPYWTPDSIFSTAPVAGTQILGFEGAGAGVNLDAPQIYVRNGPAWEDASTHVSVSNTPLRFGMAFVLRNNSDNPLQVTMLGAVPMISHRVRLATVAAGVDQDIRFGYLSPVPEPLTALQVPALTGDAILGYDNSAAGKNKSAVVIFAYNGSQWVDDLTGSPIDAGVKLQPGFGYLYRKFKTTGTAQSVVWQHVQSYLPQ